MTKKTLFIFSSLSFFAVASTALAQGFVPLAPIPGLTDPGTATSVINSDGFANFFNNLYKYVIGLAAALAVIMIIWGGLEISTQDSVSKQGAGRERITQAILGLILVLSPVLVFSIINPSILRLDIGIKPLDTVAGAAIPSATLPGTTTFTNVGTNSASGSAHVQVGDRIITVPNRANYANSQAYTDAVNQFQAAKAAAQTDCEGAGGTFSTQANTDNTITAKCAIPAP